MIALLAGAALAVAALVYVLFPLFDVRGAAPRRAPSPVREASESAIDALREIEFDRETGKLSDADYADLKAEYTRSALAELRAREGLPVPAVPTAPNDASVEPGVERAAAVEAGVVEADAAEAGAVDAAEAAILRYRAVRRECDTCGPRPEPDPAFCSTCGKYLKGACASCGAVVDPPASRFCANCGSSLAA